LTAGSSDAGVLLLGSSTALALDRHSAVHVDGGKFAIDSFSGRAAVVRGHSHVSADEIDVAGQLMPKDLGQPAGSVVHVSPLDDPSAAMIAPAPDPTIYPAVHLSRDSRRTLSPGTYVGGITIGGHAHVTLQPGLYYLQGGGLTVRGAATLEGTGVTIFNDPAKRTDDIRFVGRSHVSLAASTSGLWPNIALYQSRTSDVPLTITSHDVKIVGAVWAPAAGLRANGHARINIGGDQNSGLVGQLVVGWLAVRNHSHVNVDATPPQAHLSVTIDDSQPAAVPGGQLSYSVTVVNNGPIDVLGASITDSFSSPIGGQSYYASSNGGYGTSNSGYSGYIYPNWNGYGAINDTVYLPVGGSITYQVQTTLDSSATAGPFTHSVTVSPPSGIGIADPQEATATDAVPVTPQADLSLSLSGPDTAAIPGNPLTYNLSVHNSGPSRADGASVTASIGGQGIVSSYTVSGSDGFSASGTGDVSFTDSSLGHLGASYYDDVNYTITVATDPAATGTLSASATVTAPDGLDTNPSNNSATLSTLVVPSADLSVTIDDGANSATAGDSTTYTITVTNNGPSDVVGAHVVDNFPIGFDNFNFVIGGSLGHFGGSQFGSSGATINYAAAALSVNPIQVQPSANVVLQAAANTIDTAASNTSEPSALDLVSASTYTGTTTINSGTLQIGGGTFTSGITLSSGSTTINTGGNFFQTGPLAGVSYTAVETGGASGFTSSGSGNINDYVDLPAGASVTYTVTANLNPHASGALNDTVSVTAPGNVPDSESSNNTATDVDSIAPDPALLADLAVAQTADVQTTYHGGSLAYYSEVVTHTVVVSNNGPGNVSGADFEDSLPSGIYFTSVSTSSTGGASVSPSSGSGGIIAVRGSYPTLLDLPSGSTFTYTFTETFNTDRSSPISLVNTATITAPSGMTDAHSDNNTSTLSTQLDALPPPQADLAVTESTDVGAAHCGQTVTYTIVVSNDGPNDVSGATFSDHLPPNFLRTANSTSSTGGAAASSYGGITLGSSILTLGGNALTFGGSSLTLGGNVRTSGGTLFLFDPTSLDLPSGSTFTYTITGTLGDDGSNSSEFASTATITPPSGIVDPNLTNNTSIATIQNLGSA
jgi:uncharacterized repeat protein (TIGR01451 family)